MIGNKVGEWKLIALKRMESSVKKMNKTRKDKEFFEEIYNTTFAGLRKFVTYRCTNSALVDDILQEVYIEVFRHIDQLREHENIAGWVYKTADNKTKIFRESWVWRITADTVFFMGAVGRETTIRN